MVMFKDLDKLVEACDVMENEEENERLNKRINLKGKK